MGIPRFFYWLYKEYPYVLTKIQEKETLLKYNTVFQIMDDTTYGTGLYQNQVCFLNLIKGHCLDITDIGHTLFFSGESIIPYLDENTPKLLEPILF